MPAAVDGSTMLAAWPTLLLFAILGPIMGSFIGVIVERLPAGMPVLLARSQCASCGAVLGPLDLVPLASWLGLRGRCRHCGSRVGAFYPAVELAAFGVALWAIVATDTRPLWASCVLGWTLLALAIIDWRHLVLRDELTLPLIPAGLLAAWLVDEELLADHLLGALAGFLALWLVREAYWRLRGREGLGLGDAKLLAAAGAWLSWSGLPGVLLVAAVLALAWVTLRWLRGARLEAGDAIAFGPHLCAATWIVWLYEPAIFAGGS